MVDWKFVILPVPQLRAVIFHPFDEQTRQKKSETQVCKGKEVYDFSNLCALGSKFEESEFIGSWWVVGWRLIVGVRHDTVTSTTESGWILNKISSISKLIKSTIWRHLVFFPIARLSDESLGAFR